MGALPGMQNRMTIPVFDKSGTIASATLPQLLIPISNSRSSLTIQNISSSNMYVEFGGARATATVSNGAVTGCTITNAGFKYTLPPKVIFYGGGNTGNNQNNPNFFSAGMPDYPAPSNAAQGHCTMTGSAGNLSVLSIVIDNPGSGYAHVPYVYLLNDPLDPHGAANPFDSSVTSGVELLPWGTVSFDGNVCTTDQCSIFCATLSAPFTVKFTI